MRTLSLMPVLVALSCGPRRTGTGAAAGSVSAVGARHAAAEAVLEEAARDPEPGRRGDALAARIRTSPDAGGGAWAQQALWDPTPWVRRQGAGALAARLPEPESREALHAFIRRPEVDAYTRCGAALHLARAGDRETLPAVLAALGRATESWEAAPCALAAGEMGDAAAGARLSVALREGELPLELAFVAALGGSSIDGVAESIGVAVDLVEEPLRIPLAAAWMELGGAAGASLLRDGLLGPDLDQRLTVIDFLVGSPSDVADELLRKAASGEDGSSRRYARLVVAAHTADLGPFEAAAADEDRDVRSLAMALTGELLVRAPTLGGRATGGRWA